MPETGEICLLASSLCFLEMQLVYIGFKYCYYASKVVQGTTDRALKHPNQNIIFVDPLMTKCQQPKHSSLLFGPGNVRWKYANKETLSSFKACISQ